MESWKEVAVHLGLYTDSVPDLSFDEALDLAARVGATAIEIAGGGQSSAPHMRIDELLASGSARAAFLGAFSSRDLTIAALNCSAWPLHPVVGAAHVDLIRRTIRLAGELGVRKIVTMSGTPGDGRDASTFDWIFYPWPDDATALLARQWDEAIALWRGLAEEARAAGVERMAFELHPLHLVYNVPTLLRLREAVGPAIGANLDPSHLFWQGMDPIAVVRALGRAVHHVHLKDTEIIAEQVALAGVLDGRPFDDPTRRAWVFRTVGQVHDGAWWLGFLMALAEAGYDDALAIENEDAAFPGVSGVEQAARFTLPLIVALEGARGGAVATPP
jgi:sugar phosphate isomerase/epimerase